MYSIYIIFFVVVIFSLSSALSTHGIDPKNKMSYEILKDEEDYNVIGYKDGVAITLTGKASLDCGKMRLHFISNEYILQDVKDKVIVYRIFDKLIPYNDNSAITGSNGSDIKVVK